MGGVRDWLQDSRRLNALDSKRGSALTTRNTATALILVCKRASVCWIGSEYLAADGNAWTGEGRSHLFGNSKRDLVSQLFQQQTCLGGYTSLACSTQKEDTYEMNC